MLLCVPPSSIKPKWPRTGIVDKVAFLSRSRKDGLRASRHESWSAKRQCRRNKCVPFHVPSMDFGKRDCNFEPHRVMLYNTGNARPPSLFQNQNFPCSPPQSFIQSPPVVPKTANWNTKAWRGTPAGRVGRRLTHVSEQCCCSLSSVFRCFPWPSFEQHPLSQGSPPGRGRDGSRSRMRLSLRILLSWQHPPSHRPS